MSITFSEIETLIAKGFKVFPLKQNAKTPLISNFKERAADTAVDAQKYWFDPVLGQVQPHNIGILTDSYQDGSLLVIDIDVKKDGFRTLTELELNGRDFPVTWTQRTPSGGTHLIYRTKEPVRQGTDVLGQGIDIRSRGGYIVGAGSVIDGKKYTLENGVALADAPEWLIDACQEREVERRTVAKETLHTDSAAAVRRAKDYLIKARPAIEGQGGDARTFAVAARCKDMGVSATKALELMLEYWNPRCAPPWSFNELERKVENAYYYGKNDAGADTPENDFTATSDDEILELPKSEDPTVKAEVEVLNREFAFIVMGGKSTIIRKHENGDTSYMNVHAFHDLMKSKQVFSDKKWRKLSDVWMESENRASFNRVDFLPQQDTPAKVYNLWRGFSCEPLAENEEPTKDMLRGLELFQEHCINNICGGDLELNHWLMGYFAQIIQKPWAKPSTALVFKGKKGVGKNALIDRVGGLFKPHYLLTSNKRYLVSNFNSHLAQLLLFVLDEAFWSGDKAAEGILKDLITGNKHLIEQKGREMFSSKNLTRICIIGNEDWLVPSTVDERRFAVFTVADARREDTAFFKEMRNCIDKKGGNRLLLSHLANYDIADLNLNKAPHTSGLLAQKVESLSPLHAWWLQSLQDGQVADMDFADGNWPKEIPRQRLRDAFQQYAKNRGIRSWLPSAFGEGVRKACPGLSEHRLRVGNNRVWIYRMPPIEQARAEFESFIGHKISWPLCEDSLFD